MTSRTLLRLALAMTPAMAAPACGDERDPFAPLPPLPLMREGVAGTRQIPGFSAPGIQAGAWRLSPEVAARVDADSNVLTTRTGQRGDVAATIAPALTAVADLGDTTLSLGAEAAAIRYASLKPQNHETFALHAQAAHPLSAAVQVAGTAGWSLHDQPNWSASAGDGDGVTRYRQLSGTLGLASAFGPNRVSAALDLDRYDYLPLLRSGRWQDQSFRDQRVASASLLAEHALPGGRTLFARGRYSRATSLHPTPTFDRSSRGGEAMAGLRGDLTPLITAELAAGYQWRGYRAPGFRDWAGIAYRAKVEWYATPLVSVQLNARRDVIDSGITTAAGVVVDSVQARAFYEVRRNLNVIATAGLSRESYRDSLAPGLSARSLSTGVEARYALSSRYLVGAYARFRNRSSDSPLLARLGDAVEAGLSLRLKM